MGDCEKWDCDASHCEATPQMPHKTHAGKSQKHHIFGTLSKGTGSWDNKNEFLQLVSWDSKNIEFLRNTHKEKQNFF